MNTPLISIVIPIRNRHGARVRNCLESIKVQSIKTIEIVIADYGSNEPNYEKLIETLKPFECIVFHHSTDEIWSRPIANNMGIRRAWGEYIMTLDVDCILEQRVVEHVVRLHEENPNNIIASQVYHLKEEFDIENITLPQDYGKLRKFSEMYRPGFGALISVPREWWHKVRGYDERMSGWGASDNDIWGRAKRSGLQRIMLTEHPPPYAKIFHQWHKIHGIANEIGQKEFFRLYKINKSIWKNDRTIVRNDANWGLWNEKVYIHFPQLEGCRHEIIDI